MFRKYQKHDFRGLQNPWSFHWSDEFQKSQDIFFFGKSCSRDFGAPGCHPDTLIDLANIAVANKGSMEPICMFSEGYRPHRDVTGPMNFKRRTFFRKIVLPGFWEPGCHPCTLIDLVNTDQASNYSMETIFMFSRG